MQDPCRRNLYEQQERGVFLFVHRSWHALD